MVEETDNPKGAQAPLTVISRAVAESKRRMDSSDVAFGSARMARISSERKKNRSGTGHSLPECTPPSRCKPMMLAMAPRFCSAVSACSSALLNQASSSRRMCCRAMPNRVVTMLPMSQGACMASGAKASGDEVVMMVSFSNGNVFRSPAAKREDGTVQVGRPGKGTGEPCGSPHGPPKGPCAHKKAALRRSCAPFHPGCDNYIDNRVLACYAGKKYLKCAGKVIIVTHSMGGLVARRAAMMLAEQGQEDKILGVVHGAQPVMGAPALYRRLRPLQAPGMLAEGASPRCSASLIKRLPKRASPTWAPPNSSIAQFPS